MKPQPDQMKDALAYDFEDLKPDSVTVVMRWEKVAVPFQIAVSGSEVTLQNIRNQLRNLAQYTWIGWDDAANYCLASAAQKYSLAIVGCEQAATTHWGAATGSARPKLQAALATRLP